MLARVRAPRAARAPSVMWRADVPPRSPTPAYESGSPLFVSAEAVGGEEDEGGSEGMDLEDEDEGEANEAEGGVVLDVALVDPFGGR